MTETKLASTSNPHDRFFRAAFTRPAVISGFLQAFLPESLTQSLALEALSLHKDTFIEEELEDFRSDLLYQTAWKGTGKPVYLYFLLEHKSKPERLVGLQLHKYSSKIWVSYLEQHKAKGKARFLPIIIPLVLYHGQKPWPPQRQFGDFQVPQDTMLELYRHKFEYIVCDLSDLSAWEMKATLITRLVLRAMRNIFAKNVRAGLIDTFSLVAEIANQQSTIDIVEMILRYFVQVHPDLEDPVIREALAYTGDQQLMENFIDRYTRLGREEGLLQGIQQGMQRGERTLLFSLLTSRFGTLPDWAAQRLENADCTQLEGWGKRLLKAGSLEAVFENKE